MNRRRPNSRKGKSSKKKSIVLACCCFLGFLAYTKLVSHVLSVRPLENTVIASTRLEPLPNSNAVYKPPLESLVQGWNITGDVSWLLDFSIVGFPKTGTSTLMVYLERHANSVFIFNDERCEMGWNQHVKLIQDLYVHYRPKQRMGIKCPRDLEIDLALSNYNKFFPTTKFIVGVRHPIVWFQSFYNFRISNEFEMPPAEKLIGSCKRFNQGVCTFRANFSNHLQQIEPTRQVFLYNVDQLQHGNDTKSIQFLNDLGQFLDIPRPLQDPMIWVKPGQRKNTPEKAKEIASKKMDICEDQYVHLREVLLGISSSSADWIQNVFLKQPNVKVSSTDHFVKLLHTWYHDPCVQAQLSMTEKKYHKGISIGKHDQ